MRSVDLPTSALAQILRKEMTEVERKLWYKLWDRRLAGHKFVRQCPVGPYFADFACREAKLVVELDGSQHVDSVRDEKRDRFLVSEGYRVLRFWNMEVIETMDAVCETILAAVDRQLEPFARYKTGES